MKCSCCGKSLDNEKQAFVIKCKNKVNANILNENYILKGDVFKFKYCSECYETISKVIEDTMNSLMLKNAVEYTLPANSLCPKDSGEVSDCRDCPQCL